jgi:GxxExxY protein
MSAGAANERDELNALSNQIIGAALRVHSELGPGLLESAYEVCLAFELNNEGYRIERQVPVPVLYRGRQLECGYRIDLLVEDRIIVEIKAVERLHRVHFSQLLSQLRSRN